MYLRWETPSDLLADVARSEVLKLGVPDTGSVREDLVDLCSQVLDDYLTAHGLAVVLRLNVEALFFPELLDRSEDALFEAGRSTMVIVERAVERGELPPGTSAGLILAATAGAVLSLVTTTPAGARARLRTRGRAWIERVVDLVLAGARST